MTATVPESQACNFIKKRLRHRVPCEIHETFKNTLFTDHLRATASALRNRLPKNLNNMQVTV